MPKEIEKEVTVKVRIICIGNPMRTRKAAKAEWISVNDRLPTDSGSVIIWEVTELYPGKIHGRKTTGYYMAMTSDWRSRTGKPVEVTHWCPLPDMANPQDKPQQAVAIIEAQK